MPTTISTPTATYWRTEFATPECFVGAKQKAPSGGESGGSLWVSSGHSTSDLANDGFRPQPAVYLTVLEQESPLLGSEQIGRTNGQPPIEVGHHDTGPDRQNAGRTLAAR